MSKITYYTFQRIYRRYLQEILLFKVLNNAGWKIIHFFKELTNSGHDYELTKFTYNQKKSIIIYNTGIESYPIPQFLTKFPYWNTFPKYTLQKKVYYKSYLNARIIGGTNIIINKGKALHPCEFDPEINISPIELYGDSKIYKHKNIWNIKLKKSKIRKENISVLNLCDQVSGNYAHWISETMTKFIVSNNINEISDLPVAVDGWININHLKILELFNERSRKIIKLNNFEVCNFKKVYNISAVSYYPHEFRNSKYYYSGNKNHFFNQYALAELRLKSLSLFSNNKNEGLKIYIKRGRGNYNHRDLHNEEAIINYLVENGFFILDIKKTAITKQLELFSQANVIICPMGASISNIIFSNQNCKVIILSPIFKNANYEYWTKYLNALKNNYILVTGESLFDKVRPDISSYKIKINSIRDAINNF